MKNSFTNRLLFIMVGFGIFIGLIFPFFVKYFLHLPSSQVLTPLFFGMCTLAGLMVGGFNFFIFKSIFYDFLESVSTKLTAFQNKISSFQHEEAIDCSEEDCLITLKSNDPIVGNITNSFNDFIKTMQASMKAELITTKFLDELKQAMSVKDIADVVLDAFVKYFGADGGCIIGFDRGEFEVLKTLHADINPDQLDENELYEKMDQKQCLVHEDLDQAMMKLNIVVGQVVPKSIAFIPLRYQDQRIGIAILIAKKSFTRPFDTIESKNFIKQATPFLYNSSLIRRLETIAAIDELTGVLNRRFGIKRLNEEFSRAQRFGTSFSLCMLDIDHFKTMNDTFGHQAGDEVLKSLTLQLKEDLRSSDFILRYGGEEFIIVLPGASMVDAYTIMERVRRKTELFKLEYGSYTINYTFSTGICSYPSKVANDPSEMIRVADEALYEAKHEGRNKVIMAKDHS